MTVPSTITGARSNPPFLIQAPDWLGCNVASMRKAAKECLGSKLDLRVYTMKKVRSMINAPTGPTGTAHAEIFFTKLGMVKGTDYKMLRYKPWTEGRDLLSFGWGVVWFVWYGFINANAIRYSGDRNFNGGHAIYTRYRWYPDTLDEWMLGEHDPLHDGRHANTPEGPVRIPQWIIKGGTERYCIKNGGDRYTGHMVGYAVKKRA